MHNTIFSPASVLRLHGRPIDIDLDGSDDDDDDEDEEEEDITDDIGREIASQIFLSYGDLFDGRDGGDGASLGEISFSASGPMGGDSIDETIPPAMRKRIEEAVSCRALRRKEEIFLDRRWGVVTPPSLFFRSITINPSLP